MAHLAPLLWTALLVASPGYRDLRQSAQPIKNLGRFLEQYLGDCESTEPTFDKRGCENTASEFQKQQQGKLFSLEIEDPSGQLQFADFDKSRGAFRLHLAPFFGERALAISVGKPSQLSRDGFPIVNNVPIWVKTPPDEPEFAFRRSLERGQVRIELLMKVKKPWRLKRKANEPDYRGIDVELAGIRVLAQRGDHVLAEQTY